MLGCAPGAGTGADPVSQFEWTRDDEDHGGFSGLEVEPGGERFTALTDKGKLVAGRFVRDAGGRIIRIDAGPPVPLRGIRGESLDRTPSPDSEGLARDARGRLYVSFERRARVWRYDADDGSATTLGYIPEFAMLPINQGLEGVAIDGRNRVWTLAEEPGADGYVTWIRKGRDWSRGPVIPVTDGYSAVGLDFDDRGRLYLLERALRGVQGFQSRIRRFTVRGMAEETLFTSEVGQFDNLEGVSVWRDDAGRLRLTAISDDNFFFFQRTEFVELSPPD